MDTLDSSVLISVKPQFSHLIAKGEKTVELRKKVPANLSGRKVFVYSTYPDARIIGFFEAQTVESLPIMDLWERVRACAGIKKEEFFAYYAEKEEGYAIFFHEFVQLDNPVTLETLRERNPGFVPPQNYHYINPDDFLGVVV